MLFFTLIHRQEDALALCASTNVDLIENQETWRRHQQMVVKQLCNTRALPNRLSVSHNQYVHHILTVDGVVYSTFCELGESVAASFAFLEEIAAEFRVLYLDQVMTETRPYKFIRFDSFISKSSKVYHSPQYRSRNPPADVEKRTYNQAMGLAEERKAVTSQDNSGMIAIAAVSIVVGLVLLLLVYYLYL